MQIWPHFDQFQSPPSTYWMFVPNLVVSSDESWLDAAIDPPDSAHFGSAIALCKYVRRRTVNRQVIHFSGTRKWTTNLDGRRTKLQVGLREACDLWPSCSCNGQ
jgi:hypothetical protein